MNENAIKRIKRAIQEHGLSETLKVTGIPLDDALNIMGRNYIGQNIHKLMIDLKDYVLDDLPWGGVGINELEGWEENIDFLQNEDRLAIINSIALEGVDFTWYDVDMEENMGDMSMSWNDEKLLERPEVMIELFNFLCDFYRERFEGGREDDRFMMVESISERMNLQEHIRKVLKEENFIPFESLNTVIEDNQDGFNVNIMNGDKKIGEISFAKESLPNLYTIVDATIDDEYKGNRIYPKTIINLFKERPNIIINSLYRSPEAQKAWIYLLSNLPPNIAKSFKHYKDENTTLFQLKLRNLQESIRKVLKEETDLYNNLKTVAFKDLPFEYQRSLIIYMYEGDVVDWSLDLDRDVVAKNDDLIKTLIKDYMSVGRNKNKSFAYGLVPMKELTKEIAERMGYDSFKDYHKDYTSDNYTPRYKKDSVWPIILDMDNEELIEDGWHRFHQYYKMGLNKVPAVMLM